MHKKILMLLLAVFWAAPVFAQAPQIVSTSPTQNELNVPLSANISVTFDVDMDETTFNHSTFVVNARCSGLHLGTITYDGPSRTVTFDPLEDFDDGEVVTVVLTTGIEDSGGTPLDSAYMWSFSLEVYDGSGTFIQDSVYAVSARPFSVFCADLDNDGDLDLATNGSVFLNNGDGTFGPQSTYAAGGARCVFCADLDGDGDLDLATANGNSDNVSVFLNNGDGTFAPQSTYAAGDLTYSVFCADLDGDGDLDLATANYGLDNVSVLLNNGDSTFAPQSIYSVGVSPYSVFSADLDNDGDLDLATANFDSDNISVLLNNGDGTFAAHFVYSAGDAPNSVFSADLDGDGDLDLVTANLYSDNASVLLNNGDGTFAPQSGYAAGDGPYSIFCADLDGDGDMDLATANDFSDNVSVLLNNGDGIFSPQTIYPTGDFSSSVFSADLDGDGDMDLAVANVNSIDVSVLLNFTFREVLVTAGPDISHAARTDVSAKFYIENTGDVLDVYDVDVTDSLGWNIDPLYYEVSLDTSEVDSVFFAISIPSVPLGTTNRILVTAISQTDTSILDSASLTITCDAYGMKIAEISDVGNDQGKQVRVEWTSFPDSDPLVTDFTIFRRIDPLLFASPEDQLRSFAGKDYPPGEWDMVGTYEAFGETLYSAVVPTLKDSTIAEGMYWSAFFIRAGTDDPVVYFDSPVDSGYSLDNLSPSPPAGLLASHEPAVTKLAWSFILDSDFDYFTIYRDTLSGFTPGPSNKLGYTIDSVFVDSTAELGRTVYYRVCAADFSGNESDPSNEAAGARYMAGDANADGVLDLSDAIYLLNYLFKNGDLPTPLEAGDGSCDGIVNISDAIYVLNYLFKGGNPPAC
jgi:hypothetical protein